MKKAIFEISENRSVTVEIGESRMFGNDPTSMILVSVDDKSIPANLFVEPLACTQFYEDAGESMVYFKGVDESSEDLYDVYELSFNDVDVITKNIERMTVDGLFIAAFAEAVA